MNLMKCLMYVLECKKILGVSKAVVTGVTVAVLFCTAAKMFLLKGIDAKKIKKALKKVMQ